MSVKTMADLYFTKTPQSKRVFVCGWNGSRSNGAYILIIPDSVGESIVPSEAFRAVSAVPWFLPRVRPGGGEEYDIQDFTLFFLCIS